MDTKSIIYSCMKTGDFTLHSGQKSSHIFDTMELIKNEDFMREFRDFVYSDFLVGVDFGGAILASMYASKENVRFAIVRKDGTLYGSPIPNRFILLDDVVTTENSIKIAIGQILNKTGKYPDEIKCIVDRRHKEDKSLHIESMLECEE